MDTLQIMKKIVPEEMTALVRRYRILRAIRLLQPVGKDWPQRNRKTAYAAVDSGFKGRNECDRRRRKNTHGYGTIYKIYRWYYCF